RSGGAITAEDCPLRSDDPRHHPGRHPPGVAGAGGELPPVSRLYQCVWTIAGERGVLPTSAGRRAGDAGPRRRALAGLPGALAGRRTLARPAPWSPTTFAAPGLRALSTTDFARRRQSGGRHGAVSLGA